VKWLGCEPNHSALHLVLRIWMVELYLDSPIHLHGLVLH
jgi:hypothetical protein